MTIHTGQSYGIGIRNGASQNALQQRFWHISYSNCEYGIYLVGGNADMRHINGGQSDFGIFIGGFTAEQSSIDYYESESDARGIESDGPLTLITNSRLSNGNQFGDGFWKFGSGMVNIQNSFLEFAPHTNQVVVGTKGSSLVTSISNYWNVTLAQVGYDRFVTPPVTWINDVFDNNPPRSPTRLLYRKLTLRRRQCAVRTCEWRGVAANGDELLWRSDGDAGALCRRSAADAFVQLRALRGGHDRARREFRVCLRGEEHLEAGSALDVVRSAILNVDQISISR